MMLCNQRLSAINFCPIAPAYFDRRTSAYLYISPKHWKEPILIQKMIEIAVNVGSLCMNLGVLHNMNSIIYLGK